MKVRFLETCVGDNYSYGKGSIVDSTGNPALTEWLKDQVKAGHAEVLDKAERATVTDKAEKRTA